LRTIQYVDFASHGPEDEAVLEQVVRALDESKKAPRTEEDLREKGVERIQERSEGGQRPGEEGTLPRETPHTGKTRSITPWVYGSIGVLVVLVLALFIRGQQQSRETESGRPETHVAETPVQEREEQKTAKNEQLKEREGRNRAEMVSIPAEKFWMGCNEKVDQACDDDEKPGRNIFLDAYSIDKYEVTVAEYRRCVEARGQGCTNPDTGENCNWGKSDREDHPINCIDWNRAQGYCQWIGKRLPTEAEWEKAARGTDGRVYPWGNRWDAKNANVSGSGTVAVGSYSAGVSPYGIYDMAGNVWEWVQDWYAAGYYQQGPARNPKGPDSGVGRFVRGGSWSREPRYVRGSYRDRGGPGDRHVPLGFRCAR
jgi:formylglycine-generating enzyme required for sulfatase activity